VNERALITGGTGKTGAAIAAHARGCGFDVRVASRHAPAGDLSWARFDWEDPSSYEAALVGVSRVYLVSPAGVPDPAPLMNAFVARALDQGVRRFVLLGSSAVPIDAPGLGAVERHLRDVAPEWAVLRPSWFMQNFTGSHPHAQTVRAEGVLYTATGDGRVPFIDADDIAAVGAHALLDAGAPNDSLVLTGPAALSYDDVAHILGEALGRTVRHVRIADDEARQRLIASGIPADYAALLVMLDVAIRGGAEDRVTDVVLRVTGRPPRSFADFLRATARRA
jgi:ergot alkaloid biosynthesis protein